MQKIKRIFKYIKSKILLFRKNNSRQKKVIRKRIKSEIKTAGSNLRVILGSGNIEYKNWISTTYPHLDITSNKSMKEYLQPDSVDAFLSEHVLEHLDASSCSRALSNCYKYLKPTGYFRIAVPDGFHSSEEYIDMVKPNGTGSGSDDHKVLFNYQSLTKMLEAAGFKVNLLEWFDEEKNFNFNEWDPEDGMIRRSTRFDKRNNDSPHTYTSLIVDAIKPN